MRLALQITGWVVVGSLILFNDLLKLFSYVVITGFANLIEWVRPL